MAKVVKDVTIDVAIRKLTEKAMLIRVIRDGNIVEVWLPKSQVKETDCLAADDTGYVIIPAWLAKEKGIENDNEN